MSLLRVLHLGGVGAGRVREVLSAVQLLHLPARSADRRARERGGVGAHIGDVAVFVESLSDAHRAGGTKSHLATGFLLQGRRAKRGVRRATVGLSLHTAHLEVGVVQCLDEAFGTRLIEVNDGLVLEQSVSAEVFAAGHSHVVDRVQFGREHPLVMTGTSIERALDVPVGSTRERHALALAVNDQSSRHRLHAPRRESTHHLAPQHRANFVAVEPVKNATSFLGFD